MKFCTIHYSSHLCVSCLCECGNSENTVRNPDVTTGGRIMIPIMHAANILLTERRKPLYFKLLKRFFFLSHRSYIVFLRNPYESPGRIGDERNRNEPKVEVL